MLRTAASIADGQPVDLGDIAANLDRRALTLVLAAIAHAGGSHGDRDITHDAEGVPRAGKPLPPLIAWPTHG